MFPSFLPDSYFDRLMSRMDTADETVSGLATAHDALDGRVNGVEIAQGATNGRITDLEGLADGHNTRLAILELWRGEKAQALDKLDASNTMPTVNIGPVGLLNATNVRAIADKVDAIIDSLRDREIIEYST